MVGDGPERYHAEQQARQADICDQVIFLGKQENIKDILAITDVALFPSASESFGLAALESMAFCIPVVSSNAGGLTEVNQNGLTGYTLNVGDIDAFVEALNDILGDPDKCRLMGNAAQKFAREHYSADIVIPHYLKYYDSIIRG